VNIEISNLVHGLIIASPSLQTTKCPTRGMDISHNTCYASAEYAVVVSFCYTPVLYRNSYT